MYSIRPFRSKDISTIVDFQLKLAEETENLILDKSVLTCGVEAILSDPTKGCYSVVEDESKIIGCYLITFEWSDWRNGMIWWLQSVYVSPDYRRQGVFKQMYDHLIQSISLDPVVTGLRLYVDRSNTRAQKVYQSLGMDGDHYKLFEWIKK